MDRELDTKKRKEAWGKLHHRSPWEKMKTRNLSPNRYRSKNKIPESESYYIQLSILACVHFINEQDHLKEIADQTLLLKKHNE